MTQSDRDVLAYVVVDPDAWYKNAISAFGQTRADAALAAKVERWYQEYMTESEKPDYKTRSQREAEINI